MIKNVCFSFTSGLTRPHHVFVWILNDANVNDQTKNPFLYDTFSVSTNPRVITNAYLEVGNNYKYPENAYNVSTEMSRVYRDVLEYVHANNDFKGGTVLTRENFSSLYPFLYFNLEYQKPDIKDGTTKLTFHYKLDGATTTDYKVYALVLYEQNLEIIQSNGKLLLRA